MRVFFLFIIIAISLSLKGQQTISIYFDFDKDNVKESEQLKLKKLLESNAKPSITLVGYADFYGSNDYNIKLSERRIASVKKYLLSIYPNIIITQENGLGETEKFGDRSLNRKVDIVYEIPNTITQENNEKEEIKVIEENEKTTEIINEIDKLEIGANFILENMEFIPGEHFLQEYSKPSIQKLYNTLVKFPKVKIEIQGHICCETTYEDGLDWTTGEYNLSVNRARYVYEYLINEGIDKTRLSYKGLGRTKPLVDESTNDPQRNRRVEIKILEK